MSTVRWGEVAATANQPLSITPLQYQAQAVSQSVTKDRIQSHAPDKRGWWLIRGSTLRHGRAAATHDACAKVQFFRTTRSSNPSIGSSCKTPAFVLEFYALILTQRPEDSAENGATAITGFFVFKPTKNMPSSQIS